MREKIFEAKDLQIYKRLIRVLGEYSDRFPATGVSKLFRKAIQVGLKIVPKNELAQRVLDYVLRRDSVSAAVQTFLNTRFSDLPLEVRPVYKNGRSKEVAFWEVDGKISDKVMSLVNFEGKQGRWVDIEGNSVEIVSFDEE